MSEDGPKYVAAPPCPDCGQYEVVPIVYGLPSAELMRGADKRAYVLGGCAMSGHDPSHYCLVCGRRFIAPRRAGE